MSLSIAAGRIVIGNVLFVVCCAFYLAWWILRFRPAHSVTGTKVSWLLVPAALAGVAAVVGLIWGMSGLTLQHRWFPQWSVIVGWIVVFAVLAVGTSRLFDRPVTSELFLITGWAALTLALVNALNGSGLLSRPASLIWLAVVCLVTIASLVCYVLYYRLSGWRSYVDGMIPLILTALVMAGIAICLVTLSRRAGSSGTG